MFGTESNAGMSPPGLLRSAKSPPWSTARTNKTFARFEVPTFRNATGPSNQPAKKTRTVSGIRKCGDLWLRHELARGDEVNEFAQGVSGRFPVRLKATEGGLVSETDWAAKSVGEESVGEVVCKQIGIFDEVVSDVGWAVDRLSAILAGRVDGGSIWVDSAESPDWIVGFESEAERVDLGVTVGARLHRAMFLQLLPDGRGSANVRLDGGYVRRRRARRRAEEFLQQPDAALHRGGIHTVGGHREHAGVAEQPASWRIGRQADSLQVIAPHSRHFIEPGKTVIEIGKIRINESGNRLPGLLLTSARSPSEK